MNNQRKITGKTVLCLIRVVNQLIMCDFSSLVTSIKKYNLVIRFKKLE